MPGPTLPIQCIRMMFEKCENSVPFRPWGRRAYDFPCVDPAARSEVIEPAESDSLIHMPRPGRNTFSNPLVVFSQEHPRR